MNGIPNQCIACGLGTDEAVCPQCSKSTYIGAAETLADGAVRLGFLERGRKAPLTIAFRPVGQSSPGSGATALRSSDESTTIRSEDFRRLTPLSGLANVRSLGAALLLAAEAARRDGLVDDGEFDQVIIDQVLKNDIEACRRAALELASQGAFHKIDVLPLTEPEQSWLKAIAYLRSHDFNRATDEVLGLPTDSYPGALPMLAACRSGADTPHRDAADLAIRSRLAAHGHGVTEGAGLAIGLSGSELRWIDAAAAVPPVIPDVVRTPATCLLHVVSQPAPPRARLAAPGGVPIETIDDAIDKGAHIEANSLEARPDDRMYLTARTAPDQLSDEEVAALHFDHERTRRELVASLGSADTAAVTTSDPYLAGLVQLSAGNTVPTVVASHHPTIATQLERFFAEPSAETLTEDLARDESLWPVLTSVLGAESMGWNPPRGSASRRLLAWHWLRNGIAELFEARWQESLVSLRHAFRLSDDEGLRDEALNLIACAHWQLGNDEEAVQALTSALEGSRNPSLQVNLGVVAQDLDPETAALELARLVREAESLDLRTAAAMKAVSLWLTDEVPWGSDRDTGMPEPLTMALRSLVIDPIPLDAFRQIVKLQSSFDDDWLEQPANLAGSPHMNSAEARIYQARAAGPTTLVDVLKTELARSGTPEWVEQERDALVEMFVRHSLADESSGAGLFAFIAIDNGLPLRPEQRIMLIPLAVHGVCDYLSEQEGGGAPNDKFTTLLAEGDAAARQQDMFDRFSDLYSSAWTRLAIAQALFADKMWDEAAQTFDRVMAQISGIPKRRINMAPVREVMGAIRDSAREMERSLAPFPAHVEGEVADFVNGVLSNAQMLARRAEEVMR